MGIPTAWIFQFVFTSQKILGAISSEKLPIMILVSRSWIHIANNVERREIRRRWRKRQRKLFDFFCRWKGGSKNCGSLFSLSIQFRWKSAFFLLTMKTVREFCQSCLIAAQFTQFQGSALPWRQKLSIHNVKLSAAATSDPKLVRVSKELAFELSKKSSKSVVNGIIEQFGNLHIVEIFSQLLEKLQRTSQLQTAQRKIHTNITQHLHTL